MTKLNWNRLAFFALGTFIGGWVLGFITSGLKKV
jgi:hypothetical protein